MVPTLQFFRAQLDAVIDLSDPPAAQLRCADLPRKLYTIPS